MAGLKLDTFLFGKIVLNITFRVISICLQQHCVSEKKTSMTIFFLSVLNSTTEWFQHPVHNHLTYLSVKAKVIFSLLSLLFFF